LINSHALLLIPKGLQFLQAAEYASNLKGDYVANQSYHFGVVADRKHVQNMFVESDD
tara:strand:- start:603 stop:773 length:171 start_codon:yes stop_codon:yes gene_type:complete